MGTVAEIHIARRTGFCYGVREAIDKAKEASAAGKTTHTLGQVVHNEGVIADLEEKPGIVLYTLVDRELAERLAHLIEKAEGGKVLRGKLDIALYRDDLQTLGPAPVVGATELPLDLTGRTVVIVDDVLYTGRTIRAALDELADFGRPQRILLAVLVDRGGRELPIQPDIAGVTITVPPGQVVRVSVQERDGRDAVELVPKATT